VRVVHTTDPFKEGGSLYLQQVDPWLGYQWGRSLTQRNFRERDGVYGEAGKLDGVTLPDGVSKMMDRGHVSSCGACHNVPYRDAGAGMTMAKNGGTGRNTPHMFGGGLLEMLGLQMRLQALAIADTNRDGWISLEEARGKRCVLRNLPASVTGDAVEIDFGSFEDLDGDGYPDLNPIFFPLFVDRNGKWLPLARSLKSPGVAGYTLMVQVFGWAQPYAPLRPPISTTLRAFSATPFDIHAGLQACDPTTFTSPRGDGLGLVSNAGAQQFVIEGGKDRGVRRGPTGISKDDPDRDGYCEEITEGDLDVVEWYLLNHPAPARGRITRDVVRGERRFKEIGCTACHLPDWHLFAHNSRAEDYTERYDGDRRFFELQVAFTRRPNVWRAGCTTWPTSRVSAGSRGGGRTRFADFTAISSIMTSAPSFTRSNSTAASCGNGGRRPCGGSAARPLTGMTGPIWTWTRSSAVTAARRWRRARPTPD
jgi:hypothetical protein